ncbi:MAG: NAD(P)-dependent glycerol-3-phosphate dehydrogenase [Myxococcales bacterium]|nr:NAD(P)-dependent glycerol-3-phosphate dehydrogenase [Myxococcales bacterium]
MANVSVLGAGAFGTALAVYCSELGHQTRVWAYDEGLPERIAAAHENVIYLPGFPVPDDVLFTNNMAAALRDAELVLLAVPSGFMRSVTDQAAPDLPRGVLLTSTTKGIERDSLAFMSDILAETLPDHAGHATYLSGPSFAKDMASRLPADVTLAAPDIDMARRVQAILHSPRFRVYASDDVVGVQLGGALKNVIAVACGAANGLGLGASAVASLMTRGLAEMARLGVALGANPLTFLGLAGVGDLTLTCTSELSRNFQLGLQLAAGKTAREVVASQKAVAEGYHTAAAVHSLALRAEVDMPISEAVYRVCHEGAALSEEATRLMSRERKDELAGIFLTTANPPDRTSSEV